MEMIAKRRALGRGLGALIPNQAAEESREFGGLIPLASIQPNPQQPRRSFSEASIDELAESIRQKGILQPLLVRRTDEGFELIAGERRYRAARKLGLEMVPAAVRDANDAEMLEMALIENLQREDLNPLEEARAYQRLTTEFQLTQEEIATRVAKNRSTVANTLRLLQLPDEVQAQIASGALFAGHARALITLGEEKAKIELAREIVARRLTVRQAEQLAKQKVPSIADVELRAVEERLTEVLGTRVRVVGRRDGSGRIAIEYYSLDELNGLIDRLSAPSDAIKF